MTTPFSHRNTTLLPPGESAPPEPAAEETKAHSPSARVRLTPYPGTTVEVRRNDRGEVIDVVFRPAGGRRSTAEFGLLEVVDDVRVLQQGRLILQRGRNRVGIDYGE